MSDQNEHVYNSYSHHRSYSVDQFNTYHEFFSDLERKIGNMVVCWMISG